MEWIHGYIIYFSFWTILFARELIPLLPDTTITNPSLAVWQTISFFLFSIALLGSILPGPVYPGVKLSNGTRLVYKCNGLLILFILTTLMAFAHSRGIISITWLADNYAQFFIAANILAVVLSIILFIKGRYLTKHNSNQKKPSILHDFVMGSELNPFLFKLNFKFYSYRPAMIGWLFVNLSFLVKQYTQLGFITTRMTLYQLLTGWYVIDYFINEPKMLYTWDIIAENFGLMLVWGDYVFIVFAFSVQNFFLLSDTTPLPSFLTITTLLVFIAGFSIFRGANSQKHRFKENPNGTIWGNKPRTVGGKLLVSGYWGIGRHLNYTGDCLIALSFCIPCGFRSVLPYFYFVYLMLLTIHREKRDDDRCSQKYEQLWNEYCRNVPYRMIPFVY